MDEHYYNNPEFFMHRADMYDKYDRNGPKIYVGEYAVTRDAGLGNLRGAVGEAAFMTGLERNSDVVIMASYAPLFCNANHKRWPINLINYDSHRVFGIPSYYVQQMFAQNRGDVVLPTTVDAPLTEAAPKGGAVGVGTWLTQAEFKDIQVTRNGETLAAPDLNDTKGWKLLGDGKWKAQGGVLTQTSPAENVRAIFGDKTMDRLHPQPQSPQTRRRRRLPHPLPQPARQRQILVEHRRLGQQAPRPRDRRHRKPAGGRPD